MRAFAWFLGSILLAGTDRRIDRLSRLRARPRASRIGRFIGSPAGSPCWCCWRNWSGCGRHLHLRTKRDFGYGLPWHRFVAQNLLWGAIGVATASIGAAFLLFTHLRVPDTKFIPLRLAASRAFSSLPSDQASASHSSKKPCFAASCTPQSNANQDRGRPALLTAPLFAVLHFFAKVRIPAADLGWGSGFDLLVLSFAPLSHPAVVLDSFLSWLAVGLILSLTRRVDRQYRRGHRPSCGLGGGASHAAGRHRQRQRRPRTPPG